MYSFNDLQPTAFKFYLRQRNSSLEDDYKVFVYGLKEVYVEEVEFKTTGSVGVRFDLPDYETSTFYRITSLTTNPSYDNDKYKVSLYALETDFENNTPVWTSNNSPITASNPLNIVSYSATSIWVLVTLTQESGDSCSPLLRSLTLTYITL
jgi:hypothetical protein